MFDLFENILPVILLLQAPYWLQCNIPRQDMLSQLLCRIW